MRDALVLARSQLLASAEASKDGGNVLFLEGWSVTRLRRSTGQHRLQVRYFGRPAKAVLLAASSKIPTTVPPFMDILEDSSSL